MDRGPRQGEPGHGVAFFDLDRTLIPFNSALAYARSERRAGRLSRLRLAQSALWMGLYHLSVVDLTRAFEAAITFYRGELDEVLRERTRAWFAAEIEGALLPAAWREMGRHRAEGRPVVLLSSTSSYLCDVVVERWGFDHGIANRFEVDADGRLTGRAARPLVYGDGKVEHARRYARERGVALGESWFYTDSFSDRGLLEVVGEPRVVNPDPRLRRLARRRGWPVADWAAEAGAAARR